MLQTARNMGSHSKFCSEEKKFIIDEFLKGKTPTEVKRAFKREFGHSRKVHKIDKSSFRSVFKTYQKHGERALGLVEKKQIGGYRKPNQAAIDRVKALFEDTSPSPSTREAGRTLNLPHNTVWRYLSTYLSLKFYRVSVHLSSQTKLSLFVLLISCQKMYLENVQANSCLKGISCYHFGMILCQSGNVPCF